jgi:hypothetical protein
LLWHRIHIDPPVVWFLFHNLNFFQYFLFVIDRFLHFLQRKLCGWKTLQQLWLMGIKRIYYFLNKVFFIFKESIIYSLWLWLNLNGKKEGSHYLIVCVYNTRDEWEDLFINPRKNNRQQSLHDGGFRVPQQLQRSMLDIWIQSCEEIILFLFNLVKEKTRSFQKVI